MNDVRDGRGATPALGLWEDQGKRTEGEPHSMYDF